MAVAIEGEEEPLLVLLPCVLVVAFADADRGGLQFRKEVQTLHGFPSGPRTVPGGREDAVVLLLLIAVGMEPEKEITGRLSIYEASRTRGVLFLAPCPFQTLRRSCYLLNIHPAFKASTRTMAQIQPTATSSTTFEAIFTAALKAYEKQTKKVITSHSLATELQSCDSPSAIIALLRTQVDQSQSADEKWTKWLDPTVDVLYAFAETLSSGAALAFPPASAIFSGIGVLASSLTCVRLTDTHRLLGCQGCPRCQRGSCRPVQPHGILF